MKKTEKKQFKELSEEQLQEVTGGALIPMGACLVDEDHCPSRKFDPQCKCLG